MKKKNEIKRKQTLIFTGFYMMATLAFNELTHRFCLAKQNDHAMSI